jgi:hypothetical protein
LDLRGNEVTGEWRRLHNKELYDLSPHQTSDQIKKNELGETCSTIGREEVYTGHWWRNLRERQHSEDLCVDERIILKLIFKKWDGETWTGLIGLRKGTAGWLL